MADVRQKMALYTQGALRNIFCLGEGLGFLFDPLFQSISVVGKFNFIGFAQGDVTERANGRRVPQIRQVVDGYFDPDEFPFTVTDSVLPGFWRGVWASEDIIEAAPDRVDVIRVGPVPQAGRVCVHELFGGAAGDGGACLVGKDNALVL